MPNLWRPRPQRTYLANVSWIWCFCSCPISCGTHCSGERYAQESCSTKTSAFEFISDVGSLDIWSKHLRLILNFIYGASFFAHKLLKWAACKELCADTILFFIDSSGIQTIFFHFRENPRKSEACSPFCKQGNLCAYLVQLFIFSQFLEAIFMTNNCLFRFVLVQTKNALISIPRNCKALWRRNHLWSLRKAP